MEAESKTIDGGAGPSWFLRTGPDTIYGELSLAVLSQWAEEGRVVASNEVSVNGKDWVSAEGIPELKMDWVITLKSGARHGPLNILAVPYLYRRGVIDASAVLENKFTKRQVSAVSLLRGADSVPGEDAPAPDLGKGEKAKVADVKAPSVPAKDREKTVAPAAAKTADVKVPSVPAKEQEKTVAPPAAKSADVKAPSVPAKDQEKTVAPSAAKTADVKAPSVPAKEQEKTAALPVAKTVTGADRGEKDAAAVEVDFKPELVDVKAEDSVRRIRALEQQLASESAKVANLNRELAEERTRKATPATPQAVPAKADDADEKDRFINELRLKYGTLEKETRGALDKHKEQVSALEKSLNDRTRECEDLVLKVSKEESQRKEREQQAEAIEKKLAASAKDLEDLKLKLREEQEAHRKADLRIRSQELEREHLVAHMKEKEASGKDDAAGKEMEQHIERLKQDFDARLKAAQAEKDALAAEHDNRLKAVKADVGQKAKDLESAHAEQRRETEKLLDAATKEKSEALKAGQEQRATVSDLRQQVAKLTQEHTKQLTQAKREADEGEKVLRQELSAQQARQAAGTEAATAEQAKTVASLRSEMDALKREVEAARAREQQAKQSGLEASKELQRLKAEHAEALSKKESEHAQELAVLKRKVPAAKAAKAAQSESMAILQKDLEGLRSSHDALRESRDALETRVQKLVGELHAVKEENVKHLHIDAKHEGVVSHLKVQLADLHEEFTDRVKAIESARSAREEDLLKQIESRGA